MENSSLRRVVIYSDFNVIRKRGRGREREREGERERERERERELSDFKDPFVW